jgi:hypothetical protein
LLSSSLKTALPPLFLNWATILLQLKNGLLSLLLTGFLLKKKLVLLACEVREEQVRLEVGG